MQIKVKNIPDDSILAHELGEDEIAQVVQWGFNYSRIGKVVHRDGAILVELGTKQGWPIPFDSDSYRIKILKSGTTLQIVNGQIIVVNTPVDSIPIFQLKENEIAEIIQWGDMGNCSSNIGKIVKRKGEYLKPMFSGILLTITCDDSFRVRVLKPGTILEVVE